MYLKTLAY